MKRLLFAVVLLAVLSVGCTPLPPVPPGPSPVADASVSDVPFDPFSGAVVDCEDSTTVADRVRTCLQVTNTDTCLVDLLPAYTPADVACTVRTFDVELHERAARGTATDDELIEASAASRWIWNHRIGYRDGSTP